MKQSRKKYILALDFFLQIRLHQYNTIYKIDCFCCSLNATSCYKNVYFKVHLFQTQHSIYRLHFTHTSKYSKVLNAWKVHQECTNHFFSNAKLRAVKRKQNQAQATTVSSLKTKQVVNILEEVTKQVFFIQKRQKFASLNLSCNSSSSNSINAQVLLGCLCYATDQVYELVTPSILWHIVWASINNGYTYNTDRIVYQCYILEVHW